MRVRGIERETRPFKTEASVFKNTHGGLNMCMCEDIIEQLAAFHTFSA